MKPRRPTLVVTFHRVDGARPSAWWEAVRVTGGRFRGGYMPIGRGVIPHDLAHLATEAHFGITDGVWGLLARGATFSKGTDRKPTRPGRALVRTNRASLHRAEQLGNHHHTLWYQGRETPVGPTFDCLAERWAAVPDGGTLVVEWPLALEVGAGRREPRAAPAS